ncbi:MAG: nucleotidyltransferase domain-containing protein [Armatimonadota bacterium]
MGVNLSAVQRELGNLLAAGVVRRRRDGNRVYYQAERASPLFPDLQGIVLKTVGLADVLRAALEPVRECIEVAFVFGSVAAGEAGAESDVDLTVIGRAARDSPAAGRGERDARPGGQRGDAYAAGVGAAADRGRSFHHDSGARTEATHSGSG